MAHFIKNISDASLNVKGIFNITLCPKNDWNMHRIIFDVEKLKQSQKMCHFLPLL